MKKGINKKALIFSLFILTILAINLIAVSAPDPINPVDPVKPGEAVQKYIQDPIKNFFNNDDGKQIDNFKKECKYALEHKTPIISFVRYNFILSDRYFWKSSKTLAVCRPALKSRGIDIVYGLDKERWGIGYEPIGGYYEN